jgi:hypothetical protein
VTDGAAEPPEANASTESSPKPPDADKPGADKPRAKGGRIEVELEVARGASLGWTIAGAILGGLLIWKLGTVGVWAGIVLVAIAVYRAWNLIQTVLYPPGTIVVSDQEVSLPRGVCMPRPVKVTRSDITAVYFLRRSVPWNTAAPVLIIELGAKAMAFPRNWFASESDQRHIIHALLRDPKPAATSEPAA